MEGAWALGAGMLAQVLAIVSLRAWAWVPGTPWAFGGDATFVNMELRDLRDHGWYWHNPDLAFPFGQDATRFPELNVSHLALLRVLNLLTSDPYTPGVVYFVAGFGLAGIAMYLLARSQGIGRWGALLAGVLFANAPGHQERYGHLYLAAYWVVPVALWLVLEVARGRPLLGAAEPDSPWFRRPRAWLGVLAVLLVGTSGVYTVAFTLLLLLPVTVARRLLDGHQRAWGPGLAVMAGIGATIAVPLAAARLGGSDTLVTGRLPATRSFAESEIFAGKLMDLVLPWEGHRVDGLAAITAAYQATTRATVEASALGIVGLAGAALLLAVAAGALLGRPTRSVELRRWSGLALVCFLLYTVGGLGSFIALFGTGQVRTWSRLSLYLLAFALLAVGAVLTRVERRSQVIAGVVTASLIVVGAWDQTNPERAPNHRETAAELATLTAYTTALEERLGAGCAVFQVPVLPFPETLGPGQMNGYDQLLPYLAGDGLRWSVGAMHGTAEADWQQAIPVGDVRELARSLRSVDFCALEVARQGFAAADDPTGGLTAALGPALAASSDGQFVAYDLRVVGADGAGDAAERRRTLEPVIVSLAAYAEEVVEGQPGQYLGPRVGLQVANLGTEPRSVRVRVTLRGDGTLDRRAVVRDGDDILSTATLTEGLPAELEVVVTAAPGRSLWTLEIDGPVRKLTGTDLTIAAWAQDLTASADGDVVVVSRQAQVATGWVVP